MADAARVSAAPGPDPAATRALRANVRLCPRFVVATGSTPWLPIAYLFFGDRVGGAAFAPAGAVRADGAGR